MFLYICAIVLVALILNQDIHAAEIPSSEKPKVLKLAHNLHQTHPVHLAFIAMRDKLNTLSEGRLKMKVYPAGQMGSSTEILQMLQIGALDMAKGSASDLETFESSFSLFNLPFLFEDEQHFDAVLNGEVGRTVMQKTRALGFFCMTSYVAGYRSFYAKKPIHTPADLKGMKVRVQVSPMNLEMVRLMGGSATSMSFGEVYTALQQGVVDVAENNESSWVETRHIEVTPYFSETRHLSLPDFLTVSTQSWNRLSPQEQIWLQEAADYSARLQRENWHKSTDEAREKALASGGKMITVDREAFRQSVTPLYEQFRSKDDQRELLEQTLLLKRA
ncbi:TRAP transporter substrate-binding protein [Parendozoicomonas haliclonae]|uniref:TRAP transporter substrate-binding protein n=1 Tax=Parendozoicomonas haliclonae TaxID=1960125 RepID=UPI001A9958DA|nr:TRAP transporter substrate-binding protein [Parendozoicomonas haliclonae]